jgi:two-component system NarL family response regulator
MKVLLVDDNRLMLEGLQTLLAPYDIQIVGTATDGVKAVDMARSLRPEVILMDIRMPVCDGLKATRLIKAEMPEVKIIILTTSAEDQDLFEAVKSGACGYLLKTMDAEDLVEALNQVQKGIPPFSPGLANKLLSEFARLVKPEPAMPSRIHTEPGTTNPVSNLTSRQTEVLTLVAQGLTYKEVGARLGLSPNTVKYHMMEIMQQLHLENRAQVLSYAGQMGLRVDKPGK